MSELHIALIAEGPTDYELISAALRAILPDPFQMTLLQPEPKPGLRGNGWPGVLKWCKDAGERHCGPLSSDPTLEGYDLFIIHLDTDVALKRYADCGPAIEEMARQKNWRPLPCNQPCPPVADTCAQLEAMMRSWLSPTTPDAKTLWCLPAQSTGSWLATAILPEEHPLCADAECNPALEDALERLPKANRIRKSVRAYRENADSVRTNWAQVKTLCGQAVVFENSLREYLNRP
ncbi:hypothetical protein ACMGT0_28325 [Pseudomonas sp. RHF3.3-3]|uniref:DUF4276 family protein n=1 Tax=Pseudomonas asplenii TaxID=53407 RepID=A0A0M9GHY7_9PSED|nr:hypothetical protein [Pseudomonas fuscovaginae]KPA91652.1 hypothetical protein PF66_01938 [Pseudomonas fuscovaginae]